MQPTFSSHKVSASHQWKCSFKSRKGAWHRACEPGSERVQRCAQHGQRRPASRGVGRFFWGDEMKKRDLLKAVGAASLMSLVPQSVRTGAWAAGSDAPEKKEVKI